MNIAASLIHRARSAPHLPALSFGAQTWSYGEFVLRIFRLASGLRGVPGLVAGERMVICMENRPEFLESLFACWVAGLVAVPVNAKLHGREVAHIVRDCGARLIITLHRRQKLME